MSVSRLQHITRIGVEDMAQLADSQAKADLLRLENLDTDLRPPGVALEVTRQAIDQDAANSYLPFIGLDSLRQSATALVASQAGIDYDWQTQCLISAGGLCGILNVLLATLEPGDEVLLTSPTYVGLINRVRLAGGVPRFVPLRPQSHGWRLDLEKLAQLECRRTRVVLIMSPSMPTGAVLNQEEWRALVNFCERADCLMVDDSAMERIVFEDAEVIHPASFPGMSERVVTVGSASKEYRMIGWRVGWVVGPEPVIADTARVSISNVVCQPGIAMAAVAAAIDSPEDGIRLCNQELERRRNLLLEELSDFSLISPDGGWSLLMNVSSLGMKGQEASQRLLHRAAIAATPMVNWGESECENYLRLVFSNEPVSRLRGIGDKVHRALG